MSRRAFDIPDAEPPPKPKRKYHRCWECGRRAEIEHHVIPKVLGGKRTVWLCTHCEGKIHSRDATGLSLLIRAGQKKARERGVRLGRRRKVDVALARSLRRQGVSVADLAERFGCSRVAVYQALDGRQGA